MTDLMGKYNYRGWYVGILDEDTYADKGKETEEHGPFSKNMAKALADTFNKFAKQSKKYAVAISGREALTWKVEREALSIIGM